MEMDDDTNRQPPYCLITHWDVLQCYKNHDEDIRPGERPCRPRDRINWPCWSRDRIYWTGRPWGQWWKLKLSYTRNNPTKGHKANKLSSRGFISAEHI